MPNNTGRVTPVHPAIQDANDKVAMSNQIAQQRQALEQVSGANAQLQQENAMMNDQLAQTTAHRDQLVDDAANPMKDANTNQMSPEEATVDALLNGWEPNELIQTMVETNGMDPKQAKQLVAGAMQYIQSEPPADMQGAGTPQDAYNISNEMVGEDVNIPEEENPYR